MKKRPACGARKSPSPERPFLGAHLGAGSHTLSVPGFTQGADDSFDALGVQLHWWRHHVGKSGVAIAARQYRLDRAQRSIAVDRCNAGATRRQQIGDSCKSRGFSDFNGLKEDGWGTWIRSNFATN
jgi:hypothetical protein